MTHYHTKEQLITLLQDASHKYQTGYDDGYAGKESRSVDKEYMAGFRAGYKQAVLDEERIG